MANALETVKKIKSYSYYMKEDTSKERKRYGFISQEIEEILPDVVSMSKGIKMMEYDAIIPFLVEAIKEQNKKINSQDSINQVLQTLISNCCITNTQGLKMNNNDNSNGTNNSLGTGINDSNLGIKSTSTATLYQNNPNPFNNQTNIKYFIPSTAQSASIMLFDLQGKLVKTFPVSTFENGAITINGHELNAGMFVYSLIVDGKIVDTKNMILTQ